MNVKKINKLVIQIFKIIYTYIINSFYIILALNCISISSID